MPEHARKNTRPDPLVPVVVTLPKYAWTHIYDHEIIDAPASIGHHQRAPL